VQEKEHLQDCLDFVAARASRHSVADWTDGNFIDLSEDIQKETGILIHRNTLKRLFGKVQAGAESRPQKETRNALARYAGFEDWGQFVTQNELRKGEIVEIETERERSKPEISQEDQEEEEGNPNPHFRGDSTSNWMVGIVMLLIMVGAFYYWKTKVRNRNKQVVSWSTAARTSESVGRKAAASLF
jgi:hypothetical protein